MVTMPLGQYAVRRVDRNLRPVPAADPRSLAGGQQPGEHASGFDTTCLEVDRIKVQLPFGLQTPGLHHVWELTANPAGSQVRQR
jgi:hypothetical protein